MAVTPVGTAGRVTRVLTAKRVGIDHDEVVALGECDDLIGAGIGDVDDRAGGDLPALQARSVRRVDEIQEAAAVGVHVAARIRVPGADAAPVSARSDHVDRAVRSGGFPT